MEFCFFFIVNRMIHDKEKILEGELRCESLLNYLEATKAPRKIFASEDASGIVSKIVYDSRNNQLIGLVSPLNENGMPLINSFRADSAERIKELLTLPKSSLIYAVVAQPIKPKVPPYILQIFGTNNKFTAHDVLKRWTFTENELKR